MFAKALNHMTVARLRYDAVLQLAANLGCVGVEFRNDLPGALFDGDTPESVSARAKAMNLRILALAEVKMFNDWSDAKRDEADALMQIAKACGAESVALIPRNDGVGMGNGERQANLRIALRELKPMLESYGLLGMVEPLGFESCALRYKAEAVDTIESLGAAGTFKLVHDTFHHHLAGGGPLFAQHTGMVHISGVTDPSLATNQMGDQHRVLVDAQDRLGNVSQIAALLDAGYTGPVSFEAFSPEIHALDDPEQALGASFEFITSQIGSQKQAAIA